MLTDQEYTTLKEKYDTYHQKAKELGCVKKSGWMVIDAAEQKILEPWHVTNEEISAMEVYQFCKDIPDKYFCYVSYAPKNYTPLYLMNMKITTWTGEILGKGQFTSRLFTSNFGDKRITFSVKGINGQWYCGTFYYSAGDYGRMRLAKHQ